MTPWYQEWFSSPFYHKLYFEHDEAEAEAFIKALVNRTGMHPGARVLDIACGRGRHSKILASLGFDVTGIDLSPESIEMAKASERENLQFYVHDMRLPFWGNYFDYAINLFTSFGYFRTRREHEAALRTMAKSLKQGGLFVIDYLNVHFIEDHLQPAETREIGDTRYNITRWDDELHFYKKIIITDPSIPAPVEYTERVTKFSLGDFTEMLAFQGLQVQEVFGDYDFSPYDVRKTRRMIIMARKS